MLQICHLKIMHSGKSVGMKELTEVKYEQLFALFFDFGNFPSLLWRVLMVVNGWCPKNISQRLFCGKSVLFLVPALETPNAFACSSDQTQPPVEICLTEKATAALSTLSLIPLKFHLTYLFGRSFPIPASLVHFHQSPVSQGKGTQEGF